MGYEKIRVTAKTDEKGNVPVPVPYHGPDGALVRHRFYGVQQGKCVVGGEIVERGPGNLALLHKAERQGFITISIDAIDVTDNTGNGEQ